MKLHFNYITITIYIYIYICIYIYIYIERKSLSLVAEQEKVLVGESSSLSNRVIKSKKLEKLSGKERTHITH